MACLAFRLWSLCPYLIFGFPGIVSLSLNTIDVPAHRVVGDKAELICQFDMEGDTLYSVKWYKDDREFYRFVPNDRPRLQVFDTEGIHVDKSKSSKQQVVLTNLSLASGGTYRCEVSAEAPSFRTKTAKQDMVVVVLPSKAEIKGIQPKYQVGDLVNVTCFSNRSRPAASLTWRVNGLEVTPNARYESRYDRNAGSPYPDYLDPYLEKHGRRGPSSSNSNNKKKNFGRKDTPFIGQLIEHKPIVERVRGEKLETSALGLTFRIKPKYVKQGLKLECTASIGSVYWQSFLETPKVSPKEQISIYGNLWGSSDANGCGIVSPMIGLLITTSLHWLWLLIL